MSFAVRDAALADHPRLLQIAAEGDSEQGDAADLSFIAQHGRLLCASIGGDVIGFGGMIPVNDAAMITDLFVATSSRARGVGKRLLAELVDGWPRRMTFSSQHPAALAAYERVGMRSRGRMLYLSGPAVGGGPKLVPGAWTQDRRELVNHFAAQGAIVTAHAVVRAGVLLRLDAVDAIDECARVLRSFAAGTSVSLYVPEWHPLAAWLCERGFTATDSDVFYATDGVELPPTLAALHAGLA